MADLVYNSFLEYMADGTIDLDTDIFKIILLANTYTPNATDSIYGVGQNTYIHELANGNGYITGGATLQNVTWVRSGGTVTFDAYNPEWASATFTARYAAIYDSSASNYLICMLDFNEDKPIENGTFTVRFNASGIFSLAAV